MTSDAPRAVNPWKFPPGEVFELEFRDQQGRRCIEIFGIGLNTGMKYSKIISETLTGFDQYLEAGRAEVRRALLGDFLHGSRPQTPLGPSKQV